MNSDIQNSTSSVKRLGDMLVEAEMLTPADLSNGLDYCKKTGLPLGRVLVMLRLVDDAKLRSALHVQSLMKFENMPGALAVKALSICQTEAISIEESCKKIGWTSDKFKTGMPTALKDLKAQLSDSEQRLGLDHPELASTMIQLSAFYEDEEMWPHAESYLEAAVQKLEKAYGAVDLKVAQALTKMGSLLFIQDRFAEAQQYYERVVTIRQQLLGSDDPDVGFALLDVAEVLDVQKKWAEAEKYYLQSLRSLEQLYDCDEPTIIDVLQKLSYVCRRRNAPAEPIMVGTLLTESGMVDSEKVPEALAFSKEKGVPMARAMVMLNYLSEDELRPVLHIQLLIKSNLLPTQVAVRVLKLRTKYGTTLEETIAKVGWKMSPGQAQELATLFMLHDTLIEAEKTLAPDDMQIAVLCARLGELFEGYERYSEAEPLYKRAITIMENSPEDVEGLVLLMDRLGFVNLKQHKFEQSDALYRRALELRVEHFGEEHSDIATSCINLGRLCVQRNDHNNAVNFLQRAMRIAEKTLGDKHVEYGNVVEQLALCFYELGDHGRAEPLFWQAYNIKRQFNDSQSMELTAILTKLAEMYNKDGKYTMADSVLVLFQTNRGAIM